MAVLLHVQGSGRDPLRPFGGHAIRTVAWDRFDPGSVGQDVDTIIISPPDPLTGVDAVAAIRGAGGMHPVLLVPDESAGWRQVAATRLPGADVVLGGMRSLPDYMPSADYPHESGVWDDLGQSEDTREAARVIDLRRHIPRGGSHRLLRERLGNNHDIASAVQEFTDDLTGVDANARGRRGAPANLDAEQSHAAAVDDPEPWPGSNVTRSLTVPETQGQPAPDSPSGILLDRPTPAARTATSGDGAGHRVPGGATELQQQPRTRSRLPHDAAPRFADEEPRQQPQPGPGDGPARRRALRALQDPAVLVPALLDCVDRLDTMTDTAAAVAGFAMAQLATDAVDVIVDQSGQWRTVFTAGSAAGAGGAVEVVDATGLVSWLESFESPVVLDGGDLGSPGSWVLAGLARNVEKTVAVFLAWREPGGPAFEPASVTTMAELANDAVPPLELALQAGRLARRLSAHIS